VLFCISVRFICFIASFSAIPDSPFPKLQRYSFGKSSLSRQTANFAARRTRSFFMLHNSALMLFALFIIAHTNKNNFAVVVFQREFRSYEKKTAKNPLNTGVLGIYLLWPKMNFKGGILKRWIPKTKMHLFLS
jgi:hypothetical protein